MFAKIVPLRRLPRSLSICDYHVPRELEPSLAVGQIVSIPFGKSNIFGLVLSLHEKSLYDKKIKDILSLVSPIPFLQKDILQFFEQTSLIYNIPFGSLLQSCLLPLQKRKLQTISLVPFSSRAPSTKNLKPKFVQYLNEQEHANILISSHQPQTLILAPEIHFVKKIASTLEKNTRTAIWHSELSPKKQFETWLKIRNGEVDVIIGTRSALFLSFYHLQTIVIDAEEEKNHKNEESAPRIHVKDIAEPLSRIYGAELILTSSHPTSDTYYHLYQKDYTLDDHTIESHKTVGVIKQIPKDQPTFIDLNSEKIGHKNDYFISDRVQKAIEQTDKDVFLFLNRRGNATSLFCKDCGYRDACPTCQNPRVYHADEKKLHCHYCKSTAPIPLFCPKCGKSILMFAGYGTKQIEQTLNHFQNQTNATIIRLDSDEDKISMIEKLKEKRKKIIIGTEIAFQYLDWSTLGVCVCINLDTMLCAPEYLSEERLWHLIQKIQYERINESQFFIQTHSPTHSFWKTLIDPDVFYRNDLKKRKSFSYPPYSYMVKYFSGSENKLEAKQEAEKTKRSLENILTKRPNTGIVYDPIELHPHYFRKKYWYGIILLLEANNWEKTLAELSQTLSEDWKVDPRPNSILST